MKPAYLIPLMVAGLTTGIVYGEPAKPATAGSNEKQKALLVWTGVNRKVVRARFVSMDTGNIVLELESGDRRPVPLSWFTEASLKQAAEEAEKEGDRSIAQLREMGFVPIKHGMFTMGSPVKELGRLSFSHPKAVVDDPNNEPAPDIEPVREVVIKRDFWLKETEVTWAEWNAVRKSAEGYHYTDLGSGQNGFEGDVSGSHPVTGITWWDAIKWCNLKSQIEGKEPAYYFTAAFKPDDILITGTPVPYVKWNATGYRLPTEAEWEYACREGRNSAPPAFHSGQISHPGVEPLDVSLNKVAWYAGNSNGNTHPVKSAGTSGGNIPLDDSKSKPANSYGLYDMHGNVAEWCWDWYDLILPKDATDPRGPASGIFHVFRGGSWADPAMCCRAAYRGNLSPIAPASPLVGFRPACGSDPKVIEYEGKNRDSKRSAKPLKPLKSRN